MAAWGQLSEKRIVVIGLGEYGQFVADALMPFCAEVVLIPSYDSAQWENEVRNGDATIFCCVTIAAPEIEMIRRANAWHIVSFVFPTSIAGEQMGRLFNYGAKDVVPVRPKTAAEVIWVVEDMFSRIYDANQLSSLGE